jgi:hypothetical protein
VQVGKTKDTPVMLPAQMVEERCVYCVNSDNSGWTEIRREAWVSSSLFGVSRAVQVSSVVAVGPKTLELKAWPGVGQWAAPIPSPSQSFCQEFGLARFKSNVTKTMKGFEYILAKLQGESSGHWNLIGEAGSSVAHPDLCGPWDSLGEGG